MACGCPVARYMPDNEYRWAVCSEFKWKLFSGNQIDRSYIPIRKFIVIAFFSVELCLLLFHLTYVITVVVEISTI